jgi:hypothetical protein
VLDTRARPAVPADRRAVIRWRIEEDHQLAKQSTGLDAGQVIRWKSWHRWTQSASSPTSTWQWPPPCTGSKTPGSELATELIPLTVPELLRLLRGTVIPPPRRDRAHRLHWSIWRRRHQHRARCAHRR